MDDRLTLLPVISLPPVSPNTRRRTDLPWTRVMVALALAPMLGALVMGLIILLATRPEVLDAARMWKLLLWVLAPSLWSFFCGVIYLQSITRIRARIGRAECLLLGCASGFLLPFAMEIGNSLLVSHLPAPHWDWDDIQIFSILGLITLPFGLFGGWVLWRFGVRPSMAPTRDFAPVFD